MKIAYFDCPTGLSGNMILAALLDAGLSISCLTKELKKLKLKDYSLKFSTVSKKGFKAKHLDVLVADKGGKRTIDDIQAVIKKSGLNKNVKQLSKRIFEKLFKAESKVHGGAIFHLHETGATDAIIDIVGAAIGLDRLGIKEVYCSPLPFGYGPIKSSHGMLPNPAPATAELLRNVPVYRKNIKGELVTPTGAAIITTIAKSFTDMPKLELKRTGLGAGTSDFAEANILRLFVGESRDMAEDAVAAIETCIDDLNPEFYDHIIAILMKAGALDAYITFAKMKKKRPGVILTVLSDLRDKDKLIDKVFSETTTLGVRTYLVKREKLDRYHEQVKTKYGSVSVKIGKAGDVIKNVSPEYDDCARLSRKKGVPIKLIYDEARSKSLNRILPASRSRGPYLRI
ncbi:MAG: nickel pincer cofactor biosynthesis protein LarC [bacterium]